MATPVTTTSLKSTRTAFFSSMLSTFRPSLTNASHNNNKSSGDDFVQTAVERDKEDLNGESRNSDLDRASSGPAEDYNAIERQNSDSRLRRKRESNLKRCTWWPPFWLCWCDLLGRFKWYYSDFADALSDVGAAGRCLAGALAVGGSSTAAALAYGGILSRETKRAVGVWQTLAATSIAGVAFSIFAAAPTVIIGVTSPMVIFDLAVYSLAHLTAVDFVQLRLWVSVWSGATAVVMAAVSATSAFVNRITGFTVDIFVALACALYISSAVQMIVTAFIYEHDYVICNSTLLSNTSLMSNESNLSQVSNASHPLLILNALHSHSTPNISQASNPSKLPCLEEVDVHGRALMTLALIMATFLVALLFRESRSRLCGGPQTGRMLTELAVTLGVAASVAFDRLVAVPSRQVWLPEGLPDLVNANGGQIMAPGFAGWTTVGLGLPLGLVLYVLVFVEVTVCEMLALSASVKCTSSKCKGVGPHWDVLLVSLCNVGLGGFMGGPWVSAATTRAVLHINTLQVHNCFIDQRVTALIVSGVVGLCPMWLGAWLPSLPVATLTGALFFTGVNVALDVDLAHRIALYFRPAKQVAKQKGMTVSRLHLFTLAQASLLLLLLLLESWPLASLATPLVLLGLVPARDTIAKAYTCAQINKLDGEPIIDTIRKNDSDSVRSSER